MKIERHTKFWLVTDPTPVSTLADVCSEGTLLSLRLQFLGGLKMDRNPTIITSHAEAVDEAKKRHKARS